MKQKPWKAYLWATLPTIAGGVLAGILSGSGDNYENYKTAVITAGVAVSGGVGGTVSADGDRNGDGMERRPGPC